MAHTPESLHSKESILALGRIDVSTEAGVGELEGAAVSWMKQIDQVKWPRGLQYFENASFLQGNHLTRFYYTADAGFGFHHFGSDKSPYDNLVAKVADNRLIRPTETVVSLLTQSQPIPRVDANSELPEDEDASDLAEIVVDLLWEKPLGLHRKIREVAMLACITGTSAIEIEYGESDVPVEVPHYSVRRVKNELFDEEGEDGTVDELVEDGTDVEFRKDIMARVYSSYHLYPDPAATCAEDLTWIGRSTFVDVDWVRANFDKDEPGYYPKNLDAISQDNATKSILYWYAKFQDIIESPQYYQHGGGLAPQTFTTHGGTAPNQCLLTVIDVKPQRETPEGRTIIIAGGKIVYVGRARAWSERYPERWHPYAFFGWFKVPGKFWHVPLLSELVPLQKKINSIDSLVQANRQFMAIGQWMIPKHSKVPDGMTSGIPGQRLDYSDVPGMRAPERVKHIPLPAELLNERDQLIQSIDQIAASGAIEGNLSRSAARSGTILDFLRQEKLRSKAPMLQDFEAFVELIGQNILVEIQNNMTEEDPDLTRRIQIAAREHSSLAVQAFVGSSLRDHNAVKIDIASALLKSPEAAEAKAMEYFQATGGNVSPQERQGVMKAIGLDKYVKDIENASVNRARRMISRIVNGQIEAAFPMPGVDNARAMVPVFQKELLSDRFYDHDPKIQQVLVKTFNDYAKAASEEADREFQLELRKMASVAQAQQKVTQIEGGEAPPAES